ncbi:tetratricopeptide repeat protein [Uliginosibacterium sp. TH139]|uniref:nuclear transport factor 2 family protein n=1 Tax=Uliginosibacterium sp. TH139 TaxID=2067453 RepID=UPI000C7D0463|nr:tetratricopeptide repeat protein [Uliginosibacterium sp. TH139]PLK48826.1 DUF4440 domain-containing protein [Uliginosibacterium sp. TH139]
MRHSISRCSRICITALLALSTAALSAPAAAQATLSEAQALLAQGQRSQALDKIDRVLASTPKDRQARFLKGVILAEMNRLDDAAVVFVKLTEEAPELPEPYNNLAVIYAQQKQFDKAKAALEMAIRTHPSYAVAHENLGDLYAKMARQAYDRALQIDSSNSNAQAKLNLLRDISTAGARPATPTKPVTVAVTTPAPTAAPEVPAVKPVQAASSTAAVAASSKPAASAASSSAVAEAPAKPATADNDQRAVRSTVLSWAEAWSKKNTKEYLGYYARDFDVPDGKTRSAWEAERIDRVGKPGAIKVTLSELDIKLNGDRAIVRFKQNYQSASFKSASGKTLEMILRNGRWQIQQERIGR